MLPQDFTQKQQEIFDAFQANFRNLFSQMEKCLEDEKLKHGVLDERIKEIDVIKVSVKKLEVLAESKLKEAETTLLSANTKFKDAKTEKETSEIIISQAKNMEIAIQKQREELIEREQSVEKRIKDVQIDERRVVFERNRVERLIKDNQIKDLLK